MKKISDRGFKVYLVGGAVRDRLLGKNPKDFDLATSAKPDDLKEIFKDYKLDMSGENFGSIKFADGDSQYEITMMRCESDYKDKRHPGKITPTTNIEEDLKRRDFTVNAMAEGLDGFFDPFSGRKDLGNRLIRMVGDPKERLGEDPLRALRAVRFAVTLDFYIEDSLKEAIKAIGSEALSIPKAKVREEIEKILLSDKPALGVRLLQDYGLLEYILPEISIMKGFDQHSSFHKMDLFDHSLSVMEKTPKDLGLRYAGLFHDAGKPSCFFLDDTGEGRFYGHNEKSAEILKARLSSFSYSKKFIEKTCLLVQRHMDCANTYTKRSIRKLIRNLGEEDLYRLLYLQRADILSTSLPDLSNINLAQKLIKEVEKEKLPKKSSDINFSGEDLKALGFKEGKYLGDVLREIKDLIYQGELANDREKIRTYVQNTYKSID